MNNDRSAKCKKISPLKSGRSTKCEHNYTLHLEEKNSGVHKSRQCVPAGPGGFTGFRRLDAATIGLG